MEEQEEKFAYGVEILLSKPDDFNICKESLTRVGIKSKRGNILYQSCHILHKKGRYFITHFLELFAIDGRENNMTNEDYARRNAIVKLLDRWKLCKIKYHSDVSDATPETPIDVIPYKDKKDFELVSKYSVGNKRK